MSTAEKIIPLVPQSHNEITRVAPTLPLCLEITVSFMDEPQIFYIISNMICMRLYNSPDIFFKKTRVYFVFPPQLTSLAYFTSLQLLFHYEPQTGTKIITHKHYCKNIHHSYMGLFVLPSPDPSGTEHNL